MDWLLARQDANERKLAARQLSAGGPFCLCRRWVWPLRPSRALNVPPKLRDWNDLMICAPGAQAHRRVIAESLVSRPTSVARGPG